jgi:hypothetical protein
MADKDENLEFDRMPGSDAIDQVEDVDVDLNFGLGIDEAEPEEDETSDIETLETEDVPTAEEEVDETEAETDDEPIALDETEELEELEEVLEEPKAKKKGQMVPKSRLDEVLAKQKALQKQLDELKQANQPPPPELPSYDFEAKEREYQDFILDGEPDKAAKLCLMNCVEKLSRPLRETTKKQLSSRLQTCWKQNTPYSTKILPTITKAILKK